MARQAFRDGRPRTLAFGYLYFGYAYAQAAGYRATYRTPAQRLAFADGFGDNAGLRLLYGRPFDLQSVGGYAAWRVGGVLALAAAAFGLLAAVRATRAEEEAGRVEVVLAQPVSRRCVYLAAAVATGAGVLLLAAAEVLGLLVGRVPPGGAVLMGAATAAVAAVFAGVGAVTAQLVATRRTALGLGAVVIGVALALRVVGATVADLRWVAWLTPLGWSEQVRPFAAARPLVLLVPAVVTAVVALLAFRLTEVRDLGAGVFREKDAAAPRAVLLGSPAAFALRQQSGSLTTWVLAVAGLSFVFGTVANSISTADVPADVQHQLAKFEMGSILSPAGYLGFVFLFVVVAVSAYACAQIALARREEAEQLETVLAQPVSRLRWFASRLAVGAVALAAVAGTSGLAAWAGARVGDVHLPLSRLLAAGANALPTGLLFLGLAALAFGAAPRAGAAVGYGLLASTFLWQLVGTLLRAPRWVLDLSPFAHVATVPAQPFRPLAAGLLVAIGLTAGLLALAVFRRRDLAGA
jgi:ABC-2 type transport system permease protein